MADLARGQPALMADATARIALVSDGAEHAVTVRLGHVVG